MTDTMASQNIDLSSWDIMYTHTFRSTTQHFTSVHHDIYIYGNKGVLLSVGNMDR
jgi:hypothetical protein